MSRGSRSQEAHGHPLRGLRVLTGHAGLGRGVGRAWERADLQGDTGGAPSSSVTGSTNPPPWGRPASPAPGAPLIFVSGAVKHRGPLITGPASHLDLSRSALERPADCTLFPAINCDLCVYVKKTRTPSSSVAARGLVHDLPKCWLLSHLFRAEGFCPRGGRGGAGGQTGAMARPPVTEGAVL